MPSATPELQAQWPGCDEEAIAYLRSQGFVLRRNWTWRPPDREEDYNDRIFSAVQYLIDEWDFRGIEPDKAGDM